MNARSLRIAFVSREYPPFYGGGIGTYARWIVPALADAGARIHVITQAYDRTRPRIEIDGPVTVHRVPMGMGKGGWPNAAVRFSIGAARVIAQLHRAGRIDIAEFAECEAAGIATLLASPDRPPTIVQLHTPSEQLFMLRSFSTLVMDAPTRVYFELERMAMALSDEILAPSQFIADWAHEHYGFDRCPTVIPYATGQLPEPPPPPQNDRAPVVFFAGRIEPRKGVESLIMGFNQVAMRHPHASLRLAGADTSGAPDGGSMRAYLQTLIEPHARGRVHFLGRLDQAGLREEQSRALLCTIPSLWENFPNTCIESMSAARAVLVSDRGGMREMVGDTEGGRTFVAGDPDDLARVMGEMLEESHERLVMRGRIARERIEHLCDPVRIANARLSHMRSVIDSHRDRHDAIRRGRMLSAWMGLERACMSRVDDLTLPDISPQVTRWVNREEPQVC